MRSSSSKSQLDWISVILYFVLVSFGWINIYSTLYDANNTQPFFDEFYGKQIIWIGSSIIILIAILVIDFRFYETFSYVIYGLVIFLLLSVLVFGTEVKGSKSWFEIGGVRIQPAEFSKYAVALVLSKYLSSKSKFIGSFKEYATVGALIAVPAILIILQGDTGSALVFAAFVFVLFREGLSPLFLIIGVVAVALFIFTLLYDKLYIISVIGVLFGLSALLFRKQRNLIFLAAFIGIMASGFVFGVNFFVKNVLKPHQQNRIMVLLDPDSDPSGAGWQVTQAKIAIGSGGFNGKGYLQGTQTKFDFIPDHHTDNIFCTIGEEYGFIGTFFFIMVFVGLLVRIVTLAERQKSKFSRIYGYSVASILFFHFAVNVGMTIGLAPVVGIPLPFISYGGSALWSFTILLFIFLKLDAHKSQMLTR